MERKNNPIVSNEIPVYTHLVDRGDFVPHDHEHLEITYSVAGTIDHYIDNNKQKLDIGEMVIIKPGTKHYFVRPATCTHRDIVIDYNYFKNRVCEIDDSIFFYIENLNPKSKIKLAQKQLMDLEELLNKFNQSVLANNLVYAKILLNNVVDYILYIMYDNIYAIDKHAPLWLNELLERFTNIDYIRNGIPDLIAPLNYNRIYICRAFKKYTGVTMNEYLNDIRLNYASLLLQTTNDSIEYISNDLGFSSASFFYKQFKNKFGTSPNKYRNMNKNIFKGYNRHDE